MESTKHYEQLDESTLASLGSNTSYCRLIDLIGDAKRVLDVGCGPGNLARLLHARGAKVVGVDNDARSLDEARSVCDRVVYADLEREDLGALLAGEKFDAIVFADVLEHLRNPERHLSQIRPLLAVEGAVFASIPNIAHGAVRLALLQGAFPYQRLGLLDETHVRFFTRSSVEKLFLESGFAISRVDTTTAPIFAESDLVPLVRRADFSESVVTGIESDPDSEILQFVVRATALDVPVGYEAMRERLIDLAQELRTAEAKSAQLSRASDAGRREIDRLGAQLQSHEQRLIEAHAEIERLRESSQSLQDGYAGVVATERDAAYRQIQLLNAALVNMEGTLEVLRQSLVAAHQLAAEQEAALTESQGQLRVGEAERVALRSELNRRTAAEAQHAGLDARVQHLESLLVERTCQLAEALDANDQLRSLVGDYSSGFESLRHHLLGSRRAIAVKSGGRRGFIARIAGRIARK